MIKHARDKSSSYTIDYVKMFEHNCISLKFNKCGDRGREGVKIKISGKGMGCTPGASSLCFLHKFYGKLCWHNAKFVADNEQ